MARRKRPRSKDAKPSKPDGDGAEEPMEQEKPDEKDPSKGKGKGKYKGKRGKGKKGDGKGNPKIKKVREADEALPTPAKPMGLGVITGANRFLSDLVSVNIVSYLPLNLLGIQNIMFKMILDLIENASRKQNFTLLPFLFGAVDATAAAVRRQKYFQDTAREHPLPNAPGMDQDAYKVQPEYLPEYLHWFTQIWCTTVNSWDIKLAGSVERGKSVYYQLPGPMRFQDNQAGTAMADAPDATWSQRTSPVPNAANAIDAAQQALLPVELAWAVWFYVMENPAIAFNVMVARVIRIVWGYAVRANPRFVRRFEPLRRSFTYPLTQSQTSTLVILRGIFPQTIDAMRLALLRGGGLFCNFGIYALQEVTSFLANRASGELRNIKVQLQFLRDELVSGHLAMLSGLYVPIANYQAFFNLADVALEIRSNYPATVDDALAVLATYLVRVEVPEAERIAAYQTYLTAVSPSYASNGIVNYVSTVPSGYLPNLAAMINQAMLEYVDKLRDAGENVPLLSKQ